MNTMPLEVLEASLNEGRYTSLGGYPKCLIIKNNQCLCWDCVKENEAEIQESLAMGETSNTYYPLQAEVNWENSELYCDECGERVESAYAEPTENTQ